MAEPSAAGDVLIIGAGHAGDAAAAHLRQYGYGGTITVLGAEPHPPYHRPPLSKAWLKGEPNSTALALRAADFYQRQNIAVRLSTSAQTIDRVRRRLTVAGGETLPYAHLILATGARARTVDVPGADLPNVRTLRTRADANTLRPALAPGRHLVLIGGGYIGLEIAASARALGTDVTVIEREPRLLARVASAPLADYFRRLHQGHGVRFHLGMGIAAIHADHVVLSDGRSVPADCVVVGVGAQPNTELARAAGLDCDNGIIVDGASRTSDPAIFAIGDCASRPVPRYGRHLRLESVPNAQEQAKQAAAAITGRAVPTAETPWFWSDQYSARLQIAGLLLDVQETIVRGDLTGNKFALFHLDADGVVQAVEAINAAEEFMAGRIMIARRRIPSCMALEDPAVPIKTIIG